MLSPSPTADPATDVPGRRDATTPGGPSRGVNLVALGLLAVAVLALAYGLVLRGWLLVQLPIWGDEAIVGIMARAIDGGHFTAFIWGQHYGGLESYLMALVLKVGGGGERALNATPALLCAARCRLGGRPRLRGRAKPARSPSRRPARSGSGPTS